MKMLLMTVIMAVLGRGANTADFNFEGGPAALADLVSGLRTDSKGLETPAVSTGARISSELALFWEDMKKDVFDDVCESAEIELNRNGQLSNVLGVEGGFKRHLSKLPDEKVVLVDEVGVKLSMLSAREVLPLAEAQGLAVSISGVLEGRSWVVRPLESMHWLIPPPALSVTSHPCGTPATGRNSPKSWPKFQRAALKAV